MSAFRISGFSGLVPRLAKQLLAPHQAQVATNCDLTSGDLRPRNETKPCSPQSSATTSFPCSAWKKTAMKSGWHGTGMWTWHGRRLREIHRGASTIRATASRAYRITIPPRKGRGLTFRLFCPGRHTAPCGTFDIRIGRSRSSRNACLCLHLRHPMGRGVEAFSRRPATGKTDGAWVLSNLDTPPPNSGTVTGAARNTPSAGYVEVMLDSVFGLRTHEEISFASVSGMTDLNATFAIYSIDAGTNRIVVPLSTPQSYVAGGTWSRRHRITRAE